MRAITTMLEPAQGFFALEMYADAWTALDDLPDERKSGSEVVALRLDILLALHRLDDAVALGTGACRQFPHSAEFFLKTASALIDLCDHQKAKLLLLAGPSTLAADAGYWYALARCHGRLGEAADARKCLSECFHLDKSYREASLIEMDLDAIWRST